MRQQESRPDAWGAYAAITKYGIFLSGYKVCMDYGHIGAPIEFKQEEDYLNFLKHLEDLKHSNYRERI